MEVSNNAYVCWGVDIGYITTILQDTIKKKKKSHYLIYIDIELKKFK
jgi:hypothetical protein